MSEKQHKHGEAFCLMRYICQRCSHSEVFWNSRDGVTPYCCRCPKCAGDMLHTNWSQDRYAPDHIPEPGQAIWIDMPESLKRPAAAARIRSFDGTDWELRGQARKEMIENIIEDFRAGEPWLIHWPK